MVKKLENCTPEYIKGYYDALKIADVYFVDDFECVSNAKVYGLNSSIRRAKYPMSVDVSLLTEDLTSGIQSLAQSTQGEGHDQWLTGVIVQFDLSFSNKAWVESERYHFLDFISSQSTMHRITKFRLDEAYNDHVDPRIICVMKELVCKYNDAQNELKDMPNGAERDELREKMKDMYLDVLYNNPAGFVLTAGMTTNYRQLKTIYHQRKNHRLPEWRMFCKWIESLPMSYLITERAAA